MRRTALLAPIAAAMGAILIQGAVAQGALEPLEVLRQHYLAVNRGDAQAAAASFSEGAAIIGRGAACAPANPCSGQDIRRQLENEVRNGASYGILGVQAAGGMLTVRVEFWSLAVQAAGVSRTRFKERVTFDAEKIARYERELDLSDAETRPSRTSSG